MRLVSDTVEGLRPYEPGKPIDEVRRELGIEDPVKLASNENAWGPSPKVHDAIKDALVDLHRYPDGGAFHLRGALSSFWDIAPERFVFGNGSNELLELIVRVFVQPGQNVVTSAASFIAYKICTLAADREFREAPVAAGFGYDLEAILARVDANTRVIFIANPNNPTGTCLSAAELEAFIAAVDARCAADPPVIVLDEAYFEYVDRSDYPDSFALTARRPRTVVTRTFSKAYGLAAMRIGYAVTSPEMANYLDRVREPFNTNSLAQVAAIAALADRAHVDAVVAGTRAGREMLHNGLVERGFHVVPSQTNFLLVDFAQDCRVLHELLMREGAIARPMSPYGLSTCLRVTIGLPEENARFLAALDVVTAR
ncbi:MAG: histidinol-phosphate aminotransferase [Myxococcota bacterium]|jgi:histidinol-phosphate aminotransferase